MKRILMGISSVMLWGASAQAAVLTCNELRGAYYADAITETRATDCDAGDRSCAAKRLRQLKNTIKHYTGEDVDGSLTNLKARYQAYFTEYKIGELVIEGANIDLGDNGFELTFLEGSSREAGITIADGDLRVDGEFCGMEVKLEPYIDHNKIDALCTLVVKEVLAQKPESTFNMRACTSRTPVSKDSGNVTDFNVVNHTERSLGLDIGRNLRDMNAWYFNCSARMNRQTNEIYELSCNVE